MSAPVVHTVPDLVYQLDAFARVKEQRDVLRTACARHAEIAERHELMRRQRRSAKCWCASCKTAADLASVGATTEVQP